MRSRAARGVQGANPSTVRARAGRTWEPGLGKHTLLGAYDAARMPLADTWPFDGARRAQVLIPDLENEPLYPQRITAGDRVVGTSALLVDTDTGFQQTMFFFNR